MMTKHREVSDGDDALGSKVTHEQRVWDAQGARWTRDKSHLQLAVIENLRLSMYEKFLGLYLCSKFFLFSI